MKIELRNKNFVPGYYTIENYGEPVYVLVYSKSFSKKNPHTVNNCGLMLYQLNAIPKDCEIFKSKFN